jgi:type I restriction enzyme M protein
MVEDDLVACIVAMPGQLFRSTQIPVCLWFLSKDKSPGRDRSLNNRTGQILFIDARSLGMMVDRTLRELTDNEIKHIASVYHAWRGSNRIIDYADVPGFCKSATLSDIREHDFVLTPGRFVGAAATDTEDDEPIEEKVARLTNELFGHFDESARLEHTVRTNLERLAHGN